MSAEKIIEEYFSFKEKQQLKELREKRAIEKKTEEEKNLRESHYMHCPKCGHNMETVDMEGIEIDKCPTCLGIYFDNHELEQLLAIEYQKRKGFVHKLFGLK